MMNYEPSYSRYYKRKNRPSNDDDDGLDDDGRRESYSVSQSFKTAKEKLILDVEKKNHQGYYQPQAKEPHIYQPPAQQYKPPVESYRAPVEQYQQPAQQYDAPYQQYQAPVQQQQQQPPARSIPSLPSRPMIPANNNPEPQPTRRPGVYGKYNLPLRQNSNSGGQNSGSLGGSLKPSTGCCNCNKQNDEQQNPNLKNMDSKLIEIISNEVMDRTPPVTWNDIAGLNFVKKTIKEIVVWPMLRPDIFFGLRGPPKGLLLFGPPGTGKTLIAKCIANESKSTFFNISSSTLTSKWQGESEKLVRVLFEIARQHQPAVIFIDEIDSLLSQRSDEDRESSRRLKTEFFVQMDGAGTAADERILLIGATNRPQELDDAARRRFVKRLYIPLPEKEGRRQIVENLMAKQPNELDENDLEEIAVKTEGYSGADMTNLCREAALGPIRSLDTSSITTIEVDQIRPIMCYDFEEAMQQVKASVSQKDLDTYIKWNESFGSVPMKST